MPKSYSENLRWRAVWLAVVRGLSVREIASVLFMCEKSVHRYLSLFFFFFFFFQADHTLSRKKLSENHHIVELDA